MARVKPGLSVIDLADTDVVSSNHFWSGRAQVFVKAERTTGLRLVVHEYLAARLANSVGIPVPFGEVAGIHDNREAWVSAIAGRDGKLYPPPKLEDVLANERHILAGIAVFDVWIFNPDRAEQNLVWSEDIGVWAIDHEMAFCGDNEDGTAWMDANPSLSFNPGKLAKLGLAPTDTKSWTDLIKNHGPRMSRAAVDSAQRRGLLTVERAARYQRFLRQRATTIQELVFASLNFKEAPGIDPDLRATTQPFLT